LSFLPAARETKTPPHPKTTNTLTKNTALFPLCPHTPPLLTNQSKKQGDATKLVDDIGALKPTLFIGVPRVFDRIYGGISAQIAAGSALKKLIFGYAFSRKLSFLQGGVPQDKASPLFDRIVFSKVKQRLGGRVRIIVSGGAPLAPHVEEFLKVAMCSPVVQGYGLTETCAASCIAMPDTHEHSATVGPVLPCTEMRLESVAEMGYDAADAGRPGGEVLLRGPQLFSGYYKMPDKVRLGWGVGWGARARVCVCVLSALRFFLTRPPRQPLETKNQKQKNNNNRRPSAWTATGGSTRATSAF
jgi:acyl-CoA synthetase (AMP-forming)/AMP-acid ligase II